MDEKIGEYAFLVGLALAIILGFIPLVGVQLAAEFAPWIALVLLVIGLLVGFLNVGDKEISGFLMAAIALMLVKSVSVGLIEGSIPVLGEVIGAIVGNIATFVAPAALIVALVQIWRLASCSKGVCRK